MRQSEFGIRNEGDVEKAGVSVGGNVRRRADNNMGKG